MSEDTKRAYLLAFSPSVGTQAEISAALKQLLGSLVIHWRYDMPAAYYIISTARAAELARGLRQILGDKGRFIVTEITDNSFGWLTRESWQLIRTKTRPASSETATPGDSD
jgi:hypothetical protein